MVTSSAGDEVTNEYVKMDKQEIQKNRNMTRIYVDKAKNKDRNTNRKTDRGSNPLSSSNPNFILSLSYTLRYTLTTSHSPFSANVSEQ